MRFAMTLTDFYMMLNPMGDDEIKDFLSYEIPSEDLEACPVYSIRNTFSRPDGLEKDQPFEWPGLPPLVDDTPLPLQKVIF